MVRFNGIGDIRCKISFLLNKSLNFTPVFHILTHRGEVLYSFGMHGFHFIIFILLDYSITCLPLLRERLL